MTASTGKVGIGVQLLLGDGGSPENFTAVANVKSITWNGRDAAEIDFTHLGSTGGYKEFQTGLKDPGSVGMVLHFDPNNPTHVGATGLLGYFESRSSVNFKVDMTAVNGKTLSCKGFIKNPGDITINPENPIEANATIRCTGAPTLS